MGALPFEELAVQRATYVKYAEEIYLRICTPEDLIVMKAFAGRPQDWNDVRMTLVRQGVAKLDWAYINQHLKDLAEVKEDPGILTQLEALRSRYEGQ